MSSCDVYELNEDFVREMYCGNPTPEQIKLILEVWEPFREQIRDTISAYWETDEGWGPISWRTYRNYCFEYLPNPVADKITDPTS